MIHNNPVQLASSQVEEIIKNAITKAVKEGKLPESEISAIGVEIPNDVSHGDFASNVAMVNARNFRMAPRQIAEAIIENVDFTDSLFVKAEIAGPGFLNFFLHESWFASVVESVEDLGESWGKTNYGNGEKVMVEFVSANPTGPMHLGNARGGVIGDCLASALNAAGFKADREFYLNDAGNQIEKLGESLEARYIQILKGEDAIEFPEDGYQGVDIKEKAQLYIDEFGEGLLDVASAERRKILADYTIEVNTAAMEKTLERYRIVYDTWFKESTIHEDGTIKKIIDILAEKGMTYEKDGAIWYKATEFGEEKDEVLIRGNGIPTYFAADIAYHYNKFAVRGYERVINLWGADHHGHVARMKKAMDAIGLDGDKLDILLFQLIRLMKDGEPYRMSKRTGKFISLDDLLDMVPVDAARFFFNMRESGSAMDFDLDLAVEQSSSNPVYYVQYAHARIHSILKRVAKEGVEIRKCSQDELLMLNHPSENALIRKLADYPNVIIGVATRYETSALTYYATELANDFHKFYNDCRILGEDEGVMQARIALCNATRITLANLLGLLKISAPESM